MTSNIITLEYDVETEQIRRTGWLLKKAVLSIKIYSTAGERRQDFTTKPLSQKEQKIS